MKNGRWAWGLLAAASLLAGCKGFWDAPNSSSFTLSNSGNMSVAPGASGTSTITVTPGSSFSGTVSLTCSITTSPSSATSPATCSLSSASLTFSSTSAQTSTLTVATTSSTTTGAYDVSVTGTSGSVSESTVVCAEVSSSSGTCSASASTSGNFYILSSSSIAGYSINSSALTAITGGSVTLSSASSIAIGPNGNYLYAATLAGIVPFTINTSTGALTQGTVFGDQLGQAIAVDPSGKWLLEASDAGVLYAYPITAAGAQDTSRSIQTSIFLASNAVQPGGIAISPNGALVAVALGQTGTQIFPFNASQASPIGAAYTPITKPYGSSGSALAVAIDPQSRLLYIGETAAFNSQTNSGALRVFTIGSSSVSELNYTTPYAPAGTSPHAILPISTGNYVYVASWQSGSAGSITGYSVTTTALTPLSSTVATGTEPYGLAEDATDGFVLAVSNSGTTFDAYTLNSGQLTVPITGSPVSSPIAIAAVP